jgi:hypothetical protein
MFGKLNPSEEKALQEEVRRGTASCPRCGTLLNLTSIPPRSDVAYVRNRVLLECDGCGLKAAIDRK